MTKEEAVLISAYTGFMLTKDFSDVHKFCEELLGRPIWTHEFASKSVQTEIKEKCRPMIIEMIGKEVNMKLKVVLDPEAIMPCRAHSADAGYDLFSCEDAVIHPNTGCKFDTGVHVAIPENYVGFLKSKSGLNVNHSIQSEGVIDSGYTGSITVKLFNHGSQAVEIKKGQKISQLVLLPIITPELELVDSLEDTERGEGGFGSTGDF